MSDSQIRQARVGETVLPWYGTLSAGLLRRELAHAEDHPVLLDIDAFVQGWNRKRLTITDKALAAIARSGAAGGWPVLYGHQWQDPGAEEGVGLGAWTVGKPGAQTLVLRAEIDSAKALKSIARGVKQRWSLGWDVTEDSVVTCDDCGTDLTRDVCACQLFGAGHTLDVDAELVELSRLPRAAVPGTSSRPAAGQLSSRRLNAIHTRRIEQMGEQFAGAVNARLDEMGGDRAELVASLAGTVGMSAEDLSALLDPAADVCPTMPMIDGIGTAMEMDPATLRGAAEADGCTYETAEAETAETPDVAVEMSSRISLSHTTMDDLLGRLTQLESTVKTQTTKLRLSEQRERQTTAETLIDSEIGKRIRADRRSLATTLAARHPEIIGEFLGCIMERPGSAPRVSQTGGPPAPPIDPATLSVLDEVKALSADQPNVSRSLLWQQVERRRRLERESTGMATE